MIDPIQDALDQLLSMGLLVARDSLDIDGNVHRVDVEGQKRGKRAGWYQLRFLRLDDGREIVVGGFGIWTGDKNNAQKISVKGVRLSDAERVRMRDEQARLKERSDAQRLELAAEAAKRAAELWLKLPMEGASDYLLRKRVRAWGVKFSRGSIVVPLKNVAGKLVGLQFIAPDGSKKFLTGTSKVGAWHQIGKLDAAKPLVIAEGYATAASIHEATGWPVAVCFDCGNLLPVAKALRSLHPAQRLVIAGDDDHEKEANAGRDHADKAARAVKANIVFPLFADPSGNTDFNDLLVAEGSEIVRKQLQAAEAPQAVMYAPSDIDRDQEWFKRLVWGDHGLKPMVHNAMIVLEEHPVWKGVLGYDMFQKRLVKRKPTAYGGVAGQMRDPDEIEIAAWFGRKDTFSAAFTTAVAREACIAVAERHPFHPVKLYLESLKWDQSERLPTFFTDFFDIKNQDVVARAFALNFFISAVARIYQPGCKADCMLVLEGPQGARKSTLARLLAGDGAFADIGIPPSEKDFYQAIQGKWIVELSELASFGKADASHIKRALSVEVDTFRPSYGRNTENYPRECVFFGTVNNSDWNRDETGGRRYMPLWVDAIDIEAIRPIRDQLWAEAVHRYKAGEKWWELPPEAKEAQESRYVEDPWAEHIIRWLEGKAPSHRYASEIPAPIETTTVTEILGRALDVDFKKQDRAMQTRVGAFLTRLGWQRRDKRHFGVKIREYVRPENQKKKVKPE